MPLSRKVDPIEKYRFIHHFVPKSEENPRSPFLSIKAYLVYSLLILGFFGTLKIVSVFVPGVLGYASNIDINELLSETNKVRQEHGLQPLSFNPDLSSAASKKAQHMFAEDYWAHISPDGVKPWDFILAQRYDYEYAGENLAKNFDTSKEVVKAWYNSKSHRDNLLSDHYDEVGFAVVNGVLQGYETTLVVQMFGRTKSSKLVASSLPSQPTQTEASSTLQAETPSGGSGGEQTPAQESPGETPPGPFGVLQGPEQGGPPFSQIVGNTDAVVQGSIADLTARHLSRNVNFDVTVLSKVLLSILLLFVIFLFSLDIWYSKRQGILRITGHAFAHLSFLILLLISVWFAINPGSII